MAKSELAELLRRNLSLRIIAVLTALALWLFVNAGQREAQRQFQVPVKFRGLPAGFVIVNAYPDFVNLQVSGPSTLLSLLDPVRLGLRLDLGGVTPGRTEFKIDPQMFNIPRQTSVDRISPASVTIDVDRVVSREVPVHVRLRGTVAGGYRVAEIEAKPASVAVTGPRRALAALEAVDTEPFDLQDSTSDLERALRLETPSPLTAVSAERVSARVLVREVVESREFRGVEVKVRDSTYRFRLEPRQVSVTVQGPTRQLSALRLDGSVYVDARGVAPGVYQLPVQVDLPGGLELVRQVPEKVKLRILAQRARTRS